MLVKQFLVISMYDSNEGFNSRLRTLRESAQLRPSDICKTSGVKPSVYALYERGSRAPSLEPLRLLMKNQCFRDKSVWLILGQEEAIDYEFSTSFFPYAHSSNAKNLPELIQAWVKFNGYSIDEAASILDVSENTLNGVMYGYRTSPQFRTISKMMANKELLAIINFYLTDQIRTPSEVLFEESESEAVSV